jgi:hypothetical protein
MIREAALAINHKRIGSNTLHSASINMRQKGVC